MSGTAIARALLVAHGAPLTDLVPAARIFVGVIPQATAAPCIGITSVATVDPQTVSSKRAGSVKVSERVQITILGTSLVQCRAVMAQVRRACRDYVGTLGTFGAVTCTLDAKGPDFSSDAGLAMQTQDVRTTFDESNV